MQKKRLATICARGGSKGFKNKNIQNFFGKPLIAHTIAIVKETKLFDALAISSDSDEILRISKEAGADILIQRPEHLATDTAAKMPAIQHCAKAVQDLMDIEFTTFCDISVTSPLIIPEDIIGAVKLLESTEAINVITGALAKNSPYFSQVEAGHLGYMKLSKEPEIVFERRQDCPISYDMNGAIYVWSSASFFNVERVITDRTLIYEMPLERSVDIDHEVDFHIAKYLYSLRSRIEVRETWNT